MKTTKSKSSTKPPVYYSPGPLKVKRQEYLTSGKYMLFEIQVIKSENLKHGNPTWEYKYEKIENVISDMIKDGFFTVQINEN